MKTLSEASPVSISLVIIVIGVIYRLGGVVMRTEAKDVEHDQKISRMEDELKREIEIKQSIDTRLSVIEFEMKRIRR